MRSIDQWREKRRNRAAYRQLIGLDQRLLVDIGVGQNELDNLRRGRGSAGR